MNTANHQAERAVIAALIRDPDGRKIINLDISPDLFTVEETRQAFIAIGALITEGVEPDAATLRPIVSDATLIETETSLSEHASAANLPIYVGLLKDCRREREAQAIRQWLIKAAAAGRPAYELQAITEGLAAINSHQTQAPRFLWAEDFCQNEAREPDLIDGYIPRNSLGTVFGDSEAYKSFLMVDIAGHIATGKPWRGCDVQQGKVCFIAGEGGTGLKTRIKAWFEKHHEPMRNFAVSTVPLELCDPKNADLLISDIRRFIGDQQFALIILDTLNTHFGAGDENATADMTRFRLSALKLSQATGATVAIAHHCGLNDKTRSRGSISLHNGVDWEYRLERSGEFTTLTCTKMKDGPKPIPLSWKLVQQPLPWVDSKTTPINGAVLEPTAHTAHTAQDSHTYKVTGKSRIALDTLHAALEKHGTEDQGIVSVAEDQWRKAAYDGGITTADATQNARRMAFNRARDNLVANGKVACLDSRYWIPHTRTEPHKTAQCADVCGQDTLGRTPAQHTETISCPKCSGSGNVGYGPHNGRCYDCNGLGKIPAGTTDGNWTPQESPSFSEPLTPQDANGDAHSYNATLPPHTRTEPHKTAQCADVCGQDTLGRTPAHPHTHAHIPIRDVRVCGVQCAEVPPLKGRTLPEWITVCADDPNAGFVD